MINPIISIITHCYNSERCIEKRINSVIKQTNKNWELILINDKSKDAILKIIEQYKLMSKAIKLLEQNNCLVLSYFNRDKNINIKRFVKCL